MARAGRGAQIGPLFAAGQSEPREKENDMTLRASALAATALVLVTLPPASSHAGEASVAGRECSNHSLRGDYAFEIDGTVLNGPATGLLRGLAMTRFDGEGGLTQVDFAMVNGVPLFPDWRTVTGTYEVNADCTGRMELVPPAPVPALRLRIVVFDGGNRVTTIVEGNPTGSRGEKVR